MKAGLRSEVASLLIEEALELRHKVGEFHWSPEELRSGVEQLSTDMCEADEHFLEHVAPESPTRLRRAVWVISGATIISVNGAVDITATVGMLPAAIAVSGGFGGAMMGKGF